MNKKGFSHEEPYLIIEELLNLSLKEIQEKRLVNKKYKKIIDSEEFWQRLVKRDYNVKTYENIFRKFYTLDKFVKDVIKKDVEYFYISDMEYDVRECSFKYYTREMIEFAYNYCNENFKNSEKEIIFMYLAIADETKDIYYLNKALEITEKYEKKIFKYGRYIIFHKFFNSIDVLKKYLTKFKISKNFYQSICNSYDFSQIIKRSWYTNEDKKLYKDFSNIYN